MTDLNYYSPLTSINESEQNSLGKLHDEFNNAIGIANVSQDTMISSYMSANASKKACYTECPIEQSRKQNSIKNPSKCIPVEGIIQMSGDQTIMPWGRTKNQDYKIWVENCAGMNESECDEAGRCEMKVPTNPECVPDERVGKMKGTSRNNDYTVWELRCGSLNEQECESKTEWPNGSGGRCNNLLKDEAILFKNKVNSCKAGCDLKWPGIQGVDSGQTIGIYTDVNGKKNDITQCGELSKYGQEGFTSAPDPDCTDKFKFRTQMRVHKQLGYKYCYNDKKCTSDDTRQEADKEGLCHKSSWEVHPLTGESLNNWPPASAATSADLVAACQDAGTTNGVNNPEIEPTGDFLITNRKKEKIAISKLQSIQNKVKNSIQLINSTNLNVNSLYKIKNTDLLKQLVSYEQASNKLLNTGSNLNTLGAQQSDSLLKKNSINMNYYLWLTLAISVLGVAIAKIK